MIDDAASALAALPPDGSPVVSALALERSGLEAARFWMAMAQLCAERRARAWTAGGVGFVQRVDQ